eukprot:348010_1
MEFLASIQKFKAQEKEVEPVYVPFAEYTHPPTKVTKPADNDTDDTKQTDQDNDDNDNKDNQQSIKAISIVCISDIHMRLKELKMVPGDILVLSGDFTNK